MKKGQITLDVLLAIIIVLILLTWMQSYIELQTMQTQEIGTARQTTETTIAIGSIINTFESLNPHQDDYAKIIDPEMKGFLEDPETGIDLTNSEITLSSDLQDLGFNFEYSYPLIGEFSYEEDCVEGDPCVRR